jgi:hypothetical protein
VGLVDGVEDVGVAGVVFVGNTILLQRECDVVNVRHVENDLRLNNTQIIAIQLDILCMQGLAPW